MNLLCKRGVLVNVLYLVAAEVFGAISADGAAVLGEVGVATAVVLGIIIATVVLGADRVALEHGVELGGTLQCRHTFSTSGKGEKCDNL